MNDITLVVLISDFVQSTPTEIIQEVLNTIQYWEGSPSDFEKAKLLSAIINPQTKHKLSKLIECWSASYQRVSSEGLVISIQTALQASQTSSRPPTELIWTGPQDRSTNFRRTDQALLELISGAKNQLLVVSFAIYKARPIIEALESAILRKVKVIVCLEGQNESLGKLSFSGINAFSSSIFKLASFYTWPIENRPHTVDGKFGSLHAKLAVADRCKVFISSANLTDYAMDLNIEMGVLVEDKLIGEEITNLFDNMIVNSVFRKV